MIRTEENGGRKYWILSVDAADLFLQVSQDSNYMEHGLGEGGARYVLLGDDRALFDRLFRSVSGDLWLKVGRMSKQVSGGIVFTDDNAVMKLEISPNHDGNMAFALDGFVSDFLRAGILREWYLRSGLADMAAGCEAEAAAALGKVLGTVHYRKEAVRRPVNPIF